MPTGAEDYSLETIRRLYPREYYSLFASMSISPFFAMSLIRLKLGHEFDEILYGHDEAQVKSPWAFPKILIGPGLLFNEYIAAFEDKFLAGLGNEGVEFVFRLFTDFRNCVFNDNKSH